MAGGNNTPVRNCTLEDIDAACRDFQRYELHVISRDIGAYARDPVGGLGTEILNLKEDWFNCTRSLSQEQLHPEAVNYVLGNIRPPVGR